MRTGNGQRVASDRWLKLPILVYAALAVAPSPSFAQSVGPNSPSAVVSDPIVAGATWSFPMNAIVSDDIYAQSPIQLTSTSELLKATGFGFALPATAVIRGIEARVEKRSLLNLTRDNAVRIVKGGSPGAADRSELGPQFGFGISAKDGGLDLAAVDRIDLTVHYSLCGDTIVSPGEECDDGNTDNDDC
jgi:hypothetical protein